MTILFRSEPRTIERRFMTAPLSVPSPLEVSGASSRLSQFDALKIAAVVACVGMRAGAFAQLPLKGYRDVNGIAQPLDVQPELLRNPSDNVVPSVWKTQLSISRDLWGFALAQIVAFDAALYPTKAEWLDPSHVDYRIEGGAPVWRYKGTPLDSSTLIHIPSRFVLPGNPVGMSPLEHSGLVDLAKRAQDFGRDWFRNGAIPSAILYSDDVMDTGEADSLLQRIKQRWSMRQPAVIGSGLKYEQVSIAANESQFLETCRQAASDIAISFNLPPERISAQVSGQSVTYANREQNQQQYLVDSINPDLVVIQECLDRWSPRTQYCRFSTGALLRSDLKTRYESYEIGIRSKFMTPNEARAFEEWRPIDGGDAVVSVEPAPVDQSRTDDGSAETRGGVTVVLPEVTVESPQIHLDSQLIADSIARQEPPVVNVNVEAPEVRVEPPVVNVEPPVVNVAAPVVNVPAPEAPKRMYRRLVRDADGNITGAIEEPA